MARSEVIFTLAIMAAIAESAHAVPAYKGVSYTSFGSDVLSSSASDQSLLNMSQVGADTVALNFWWFQNSVSANSMAEDFTRYSSTMSSVSHAIDTIHGLGMKVLLKPMLDVSDASGTWRAYIDPSDKDQWFANYTNFVGAFADMAQSKGVELLSIGCEMNTLEQSANNARWTNLIANMRSRYGGKLTYAANWGALDQNVGGYQNVPWWNQLDDIGIDAYFPIASQNNTTLAGLTAAWQNQANSIESWRAGRGLTNKQVLFTEVGYQSADGAAQAPYGVSGSPPVDLQEQADAYHALLDVMTGKPWWDGAFWWSWETNPYAGGANDSGFTPQNKPAQTILQQYYGGTAGDFNHNGFVDAADYVVWRDTYGSSTDLRADANLNGVVDIGDYQLWKSNFGAFGASVAATGANAAVPEPATLATLIVGLLAICACRRTAPVPGFPASISKKRFPARLTPPERLVDPSDRIVTWRFNLLGTTNRK